MSFSIFNSFNGNSQRLGQKYSVISRDINPPAAINYISSDSSSVTFSFNAPSTDATIVSYTPYVNGKQYSGSGGPSSYTINGLNPGGQYTINMVANILSTSSTTTTTVSTFTPKSISGCIAWWDASDPYGTGTPPANGTAISTWTDKSGSGYNGIAQSGLTATYTSASKTLNFNNAYYTTNYPANPTYETCFMVFNYTNTNAELLLIGSTPGGRIVDIYNTGYSISTSYAAGSTNSNGFSTDGINNLAVTVINTNANAYSSINGALTMDGPNAIGAFGAGKTTFLGRDGNPKIFYGNVCEIIFYNVVLSATDRQKVEGYLAWKWSIQSKLPSGHPYYSTNGYITSSTVTTTKSQKVLSNPSPALSVSTLSPFPTNIQLISATTTSLTFSFTAPTTGSTPTGYTPYVNGTATTGSGTPSSYTISGLSAGTNYSVNIAANYGSIFSPASVAGCCLWLDASDNSTITYSSGSNVSGWTDKSTNHFAFSQSTTNLQPQLITNSLNGCPTMKFTSAYSTYLGGPTNFEVGLNSYALFAVFKFNDSGSNGSIFNKSRAGPGAGRIILIRESGKIIPGLTLQYNDGLSGTTYTDTTPANTYRILCFVYNHGTYTTSVYENGTFKIMNVYSSADASTYLSNSYYMMVGGYNDFGGGYGLSGYYLDGNIAEILCYTNSYDMTTTTRQQIEAYLAWKWGLQTYLPSSHPYYSTSINTPVTSYNSSSISLTTAAPRNLSATWTPNYSSLVAYYKFDDVASTTSPVELINGYNGTIGGGVTFGSSGFVDSSVSFNGTTGKISVPYQVFNNLSQGTISAWVYLNNNTNSCICSKQHDGVGTYLTFFVGSYWTNNPMITAGTPGKLYMGYGGGGNTPFSSNATLAINTWYHIAYVFNGTNASYYINGQLDNSTTTQSNYLYLSDATPTATLIGGFYCLSTLYSPFNGKIDDFAVWNTALSASNISNIYNYQSTGILNTFYLNTTTNLTNYYQFESADLSGTTLLNKVTNTYNASLINGPAIVSTTGNYKIGSSAISFTAASSQYITLPSYTDTTNKTFALWFNTSSINTFLFNFRSSGNTNPLCVYTYTGGYLHLVYGSNDQTISVAVTDGTWKHLVWSMSGTTWTVYINGALVSTLTGMPTTNGTVRGENALGCSYSPSTYGTGNFFQGYMDDFRMYNSALSATDAALLYGYGTGTPYLNSSTNLLYYYPFDSADVTGTTMKNYATNTNDLTLVGGATVSSTAYKVGSSSLYLNGSQYATNALNFTVNGSTNNNGISVAFWQKISNTVQVIFEISDSANNLFHLRAVNGDLELLVQSGSPTAYYGGYYSGITAYINDGNWHHIVWVIPSGASTTWAFYVDGVPFSVAFTTGGYAGYKYPISTTYNKLTIGADRTNANKFTGYIDDFRLYNSTLSAVDVTNLYSYS